MRGLPRAFERIAKIKCVGTRCALTVYQKRSCRVRHASGAVRLVWRGLPATAPALPWPALAGPTAGYWRKDQRPQPFIRSQDVVCARMTRHIHTVVKVIHDVVVQHDRNHGGLRGTTRAHGWLGTSGWNGSEIPSATMIRRRRTRSDDTAVACFCLMRLRTPPAGARP